MDGVGMTEKHSQLLTYLAIERRWEDRTHRRTHVGGTIVHIGVHVWLGFVEGTKGRRSVGVAMAGDCGGMAQGFVVLSKGRRRDCEVLTEGLRKYPFKNFVGIVERSGASKGVKIPPGRPIYNAICNA